MNTAGEETGVAQLLPLQLAEAGQVVPGGVLAGHPSSFRFRERDASQHLYVCIQFFVP